MSSADFDLPKIRSLTEAYFSSDANSNAAILTELTDGLLQGNAGGIKNLVEALGTQLTSSETPIRIKGMSLLSRVVAKLAEKISLTKPVSPGSASSSTETEIVTTFAEFFLMRLEDETTMIESTEALAALISSGRLSQRLCELVLKKLYTDVSVHLQSSPQLVRRGAYWVLKCALEDEIGGGNLAVKKMGEELVAGFVSAMDAEKEPRNLLIALLVFPRLVWSVPQHVTHQEDLFEISSCYFPIAFSERTDDPNAIRKASLVQALRHTMCTSTEFWIPFLLEKLASTLIETKLEVLYSLHHALTWTISLQPTSPAPLATFSVHTPLSSMAIESLFKPFKIPQLGTLFWRFEQVQPFAIALSNALIKEVINTTDEQVAQHATEVLTDLTKFFKFSANGASTAVPSPESRLNALHALTDAVFKQCLPYLNLVDTNGSKSSTPDSKLATMASKIVHAVTCGSSDAASIVLKRLIPILEKKWLQDPANRSFVLRQLLNLALASSVFSTNTSGTQMQVDGSNSIEPSSHPMSDYAESVVRIMLSSCQETQSHAQDQVDAMEALAVVSTLGNGSLLSPSLLGQILTALYQKMLENSHVESTSVAAVGLKLAALKAICKFHSVHASFALAESRMLPIWTDLRTRLQNISSDAIERNYNDLAELVASLHLLCDPTSLPPSHDETAHSEALSVTPSITLAIQEELIKGLESKSDDSRVFSILLSSLSRTASSTDQYHLIYSLISKHKASDPEKETAWLQAVHKWFPLLGQHVASSALPTSASQLEFFNKVYETFIGDTKTTEKMDTSSETHDLCYPTLGAIIVALPLQTLITPTDPALNDLSSNPDGLVGKLIHLLNLFVQVVASSSSMPSAPSKFMLNESSAASHIAKSLTKEEWCLEAIGSLLNKMPSPSSVLDSFVQSSLVDTMLKAIESAEEPTCKIHLLTIAAKSLVQRNHAKSMFLVSALVGLLKTGKTQAVKHVVAQQMEILLGTKSAALPFASPLYKQKVWNTFLPVLVNDYSKADADQQSIYMQATGGMLQNLPRGVLLHSASALLPILLTGLKRYGEPVCQESVSALFNMLHASEKDVLTLFEPHITSLVSPLVAITSSAAPKHKHAHMGEKTDSAKTNESAVEPAQTRLQAVECLKILLKMPYTKIIPWRNVVVEGLQPALDDPKRAVRKQVVATRNEWYMVGKLKQ